MVAVLANLVAILGVIILLGCIMGFLTDALPRPDPSIEEKDL